MKRSLLSVLLITVLIGLIRQVLAGPNIIPRQPVADDGQTSLQSEEESDDGKVSESVSVIFPPFPPYPPFPEYPPVPSWAYPQEVEPAWHDGYSHRKGKKWCHHRWC